MLGQIEQGIANTRLSKVIVMDKHSLMRGVALHGHAGAVSTWLHRLIAGAGIAAALVLAGVGAGDAWAHPTLVTTDPVSQTTVGTSPASITLVFSEAVTFRPDALTLLDASGRQVPVAPASIERDGTAMTTRPRRPLAPGTYTVRWRVTGDDGDEIEEEFSFAVGVAPNVGMSRHANTGPGWGTALLRWLLLTGLAVTVGTLVAQRATDAAREEHPQLPRLRSWAPAGVVMAIVAVIGLLAQRVSDAGDFAAAWQGRAGAVLIVEGASLLITAAVIRFGRWGLAPLVIGIAAEGIRSHATINLGPLGTVLVGVHLAAVTVWVGALLQTTRAVLAWRHEGAAARSVMMRYVRIALWAYLLVVATGILIALAFVSLSQLTSTTYGWVLLIKLGLVAAASLAALAGRLIHRGSLRISLLGNVMRVETGLLAAVLATSALLISTPPPNNQAHVTKPQPRISFDPAISWQPPLRHPTSTAADVPGKPCTTRSVTVWSESLRPDRATSQTPGQRDRSRTTGANSRAAGARIGVVEVHDMAPLGRGSWVPRWRPIGRVVRLLTTVCFEYAARMVT